MSPLYGNIKLLSQVRGRRWGGEEGLRLWIRFPRILLSVMGGAWAPRQSPIPALRAILDSDGTPPPEVKGVPTPTPSLPREMDKITSVSWG